MGRILFSLALLLLVNDTLYSQSKTRDSQKPSESPSPGANSHYLGILNPSAKTTAILKVVNENVANLVIKEIATSCKCTQAGVSSAEWPADKEVELTVEIEAGQKEGNQAVHVDLIAQKDGADNGEQIIVKKVFVFDVRRDCSMLFVPDDLTIRAGETKEFHVVNFGRLPWQDFRCDCNFRSFKIESEIAEAEFSGQKRQYAKVRLTLQESDATPLRLVDFRFLASNSRSLDAMTVLGVKSISV